MRSILKKTNNITLIDKLDAIIFNTGICEGRTRDDVNMLFQKINILNYYAVFLAILLKILDRC
ncbi:MAG: hypothetical protein ACTSYU_03925 [Promethearchaeota archaeon]